MVDVENVPLSRLDVYMFFFMTYDKHSAAINVLDDVHIILDKVSDLLAMFVLLALYF